MSFDFVATSSTEQTPNETYLIGCYELGMTIHELFYFKRYGRQAHFENAKLELSDFVSMLRMLTQQVRHVDYEMCRSSVITGRRLKTVEELLADLSGEYSRVHKCIPPMFGHILACLNDIVDICNTYGWTLMELESIGEKRYLDRQRDLAMHGTDKAITKHVTVEQAHNNAIMRQFH